MDPKYFTKRHAGIDLGTTNSVIALYNKEKTVVEVIENSLGKRLTLSVVGYHEEVVIGEEAVSDWENYPSSTFSQSKRIIGLDSNDTNFIKVKPTLGLVSLSGGKIIN